MITTPFWYTDISILYEKDSIIEIFPSKRFDILRKIAENDLNNLGDTSTLADPNVVNDLISNSCSS